MLAKIANAPCFKPFTITAMKEEVNHLMSILTLCPSKLGKKITMLVGHMQHLGLDPWIKDKLGPSF